MRVGLERRIEQLAAEAAEARARAARIRASWRFRILGPRIDARAAQEAQEAQDAAEAAERTAAGLRAAQAALQRRWPRG